MQQTNVPFKGDQVLRMSLGFHSSGHLPNRKKRRNIYQRDSSTISSELYIIQLVIGKDGRLKRIYHLKSDVK